MSSQPTFIWRRSNKKLRQGEFWLEYFCLTGLLLAALGLFAVGLGTLPLSNEEAVLARIASETYESSSSLKSWLFPTLWEEPVLDRPPFVTNLIALVYVLCGVSEFTTRLPGALLSVVSVLLLYQIGREIFIARLPALFSASIYLTFLPVVRLGRLATFEGGLLCLEILTVWAILRSRRDLRWAIVGGIAWGAVGMSSGVHSLEILAVVLIFLGWDTPRLLSSSYLWLGICLGVAPASLWYILQWYRYQDAIALTQIWHLLLPTGTSDLAILTPSPLLSPLQYFVPWSIVIFSGLQSVRQNLHWGWSRLIVAWAGITALGILLTADKTYGNIVSICPALALAGGLELERIRNLPSYIKFPRLWGTAWGIMAISIVVAGVYGKLRYQTDLYLAAIVVALAMTLAIASLAVFRRDTQFMSLLFWGLYVSLFVFVSSPYWIWEQNAFEPLKTLTTLTERVPQGEIVYTSKPQNTSALSFYSQRQVKFLDPQPLERYWRESSSAYLLLDEEAVRELKISETALVEAPALNRSWFLAFRHRD